MKRYIVTVTAPGTFTADLLVEAHDEADARRVALEMRGHHWHQETIDLQDQHVESCTCITPEGGSDD